MDPVLRLLSQRSKLNATLTCDHLSNCYDELESCFCPPDESDPLLTLREIFSARCPNSVNKLVSSCARLVFDAEQAEDSHLVALFTVTSSFPHPLAATVLVLGCRLLAWISSVCVCVCVQHDQTFRKKNLSMQNVAMFLKLCPFDCMNTWMPVRLLVTPQRIYAWFACCVQKLHWRAQ